MLANIGQVAAIFSLATCSFPLMAQDALFSGPQPGERLPAFQAQAVFGEQAGQRVDVGKDHDGPTLLVFSHQVTRPSIALTRLLLDFAATQKQHNVRSALVFLTDDPTDTEAWMKRARRALPKHVDPLVSVEGLDGPGAYGLNRDMTLTVIVANQRKVTANFPLVQPSVQADAPKIGKALLQTLGIDKTPTLAEMGLRQNQMRPRSNGNPRQDARYRQLMAPVIRKTATPEEVDQAARRVEELANRQPWFKQRVQHAANLIVNGGRLKQYGTPRAQEYLQKWAKEFAPRETVRPPVAVKPTTEGEPDKTSSSEPTKPE